LNYDAEGDSRYPLKELAHLENDFLRSLQKRSTGLEDSWVRLGRLEAFLKHHPQVMDLRIATLLFQAERGQTQFLDLADSLLMKWGCDEWIKQPLRAWLNQLREPSALGDIELALMKAAPWDRNRWRLWMAKSSQPLKRFILKTDQSQVELEAIPSPLPSADLVFHESSGEVSVRGKAPKNFSRKRALRQLLSVLLTNAPRPVPKETLCAAIWGESYSPLIHDPRIYTLIQRCRESFLLKDLVIQGTGGYQFNNRYSYVLIRDNQSLGTEVNNTHSLILSCLEGFSKQGKVEVSRGELQDSTGIPEATLKRSLSKLVNDGQLQRKGSFSKVVYSLPIARR
jgi:DNA-binding winged helix-turn-helix (wHTH) protein